MVTKTALKILQLRIEVVLCCAQIEGLTAQLQKIRKEKWQNGKRIYSPKVFLSSIHHP